VSGPYRLYPDRRLQVILDPGPDLDPFPDPGQNLTFKEHKIK